MGKLIWEKPATRDDPIYKEGLTISTPSSARGSTPSTPRSPKTHGKVSAPGTKAKAPRAASKPTATKEE